MSENIEKGIIIDGVDVSGCSLLQYDYGKNINKKVADCLGFDGVYGVFCSDNPDCYYKQLQREKQKNEKTEKTLKRIEEIAEDRSLYCEDCTREIITCEDCGYIKILSKIKEV